MEYVPTFTPRITQNFDAVNMFHHQELVTRISQEGPALKPGHGMVYQ
jgi:hypothetical protein